MNTIIKGINIELTGAISDYVRKRMKSLSKFLTREDSQIEVEVSKTTNHHKNGEVYKADVSIVSKGKRFFASASKENLYSAVDAVKEEITRTLMRDKDRTQTLFKRGALSVKKMFKGLTKRNPETSKYS